MELNKNVDISFYINKLPYELQEMIFNYIIDDLFCENKLVTHWNGVNQATFWLFYKFPNFKFIYKYYMKNIDKHIDPIILILNKWWNTVICIDYITIYPTLAQQGSNNNTNTTTTTISDIKHTEDEYFIKKSYRLIYTPITNMNLLGLRLKDKLSKYHPFIIDVCVNFIYINTKTSWPLVHLP